MFNFSLCICSSGLNKLQISRAHRLTLLYTLKAKEAEQSYGNSIPRPQLKNCISWGARIWKLSSHGSRFPWRRGGLWGLPSLAGQKTKQAQSDATATHISLHMKCATLQRKHGAQAKATPPLTHTNKCSLGKEHKWYLGIFFLEGSSEEWSFPHSQQVALEGRSHGRRGVPSKTPREEPAMGQTHPRPAHLSFGLLSTKWLVFNYFPTFFRMNTKMSHKTSVSRTPLASNCVRLRSGWSREWWPSLRKGQLITAPPPLHLLSYCPDPTDTGLCHRSTHPRPNPYTPLHRNVSLKLQTKEKERWKVGKRWQVMIQKSPEMALRGLSKRSGTWPGRHSSLWGPEHRAMWSVLIALMIHGGGPRSGLSSCCLSVCSACTWRVRGNHHLSFNEVVTNVGLRPQVSWKEREAVAPAQMWELKTPRCLDYKLPEVREDAWG